VEAVKKIYSVLNIPATSKQKADNYYRLALKELQAVTIENEFKDQLFLLAETVMKREH
jgi:geranylgeranyl pyrophosphate synthase